MSDAVMYACGSKILIKFDVDKVLTVRPAGPNWGLGYVGRAALIGGECGFPPWQRNVG
jgi:hypothetical protein